jgi:hypothetical protein
VLTQTVTAAEYADVFAQERTKTYASVDAFEARMGFALDNDRLLGAYWPVR